MANQELSTGNILAGFRETSDEETKVRYFRTLRKFVRQSSQKWYSELNVALYAVFRHICHEPRTPNIQEQNSVRTAALYALGSIIERETGLVHEIRGIFVPTPDGTGIKTLNFPNGTTLGDQLALMAKTETSDQVRRAAQYVCNILDPIRYPLKGPNILERGIDVMNTPQPKITG